MYNPPAKVRSAITVALVEVGVPRTTASKIVENVTREMRTSDLYHLRDQVADQIHGNCVLSGVMLRLKTKALIARTISAEVRCYAATLTMRWGENPRRPDEKPHKGLPRRFEEVAFFPGRMLAAADWPDLHGHNDPEKPWLNGCRLAWARKLRDQCRAEGKAFFMKQLGARPILNGKQLDLIDGHGGDWDEWPRDLRIREVPPEFRKRES